MVQILPWMHSTFKELSNEYSHAQIRVKTKKLWPRQVREEKPVAVKKIVSRPDLMSRPGNCVTTKFDVVTRRPMSRQTCVVTSLLCRDQKRCRNLKKAEK